MRPVTASRPDELVGTERQTVDAKRPVRIRGGEAEVADGDLRETDRGHAVACEESAVEIGGRAERHRGGGDGAADHRRGGAAASRRRARHPARFDCVGAGGHRDRARAARSRRWCRRASRSGTRAPGPSRPQLQPARPTPRAPAARGCRGRAARSSRRSSGRARATRGSNRRAAAERVDRLDEVRRGTSQRRGREIEELRSVAEAAAGVGHAPHTRVAIRERTVRAEVDVHRCARDRQAVGVERRFR